VATTGDWSDILNKPSNIVTDANYVHTDENFTSAEKTKLGGIESGAQVNVNADWNAAAGTAGAILNKPANLVQDANYVHTDENFTGALQTKLNGIESGAQVNVKPNWNAAAGSASEILNKPAIPTVDQTTMAPVRTHRAVLPLQAVSAVPLAESRTHLPLATASTSRTT
jgi:hypothetical protein